jgi:uncharacterized membrane protein
MTGPAAISWAARLGWLNLGGTWLAFLGAAAAPYIATVIALAEIVNDKLPKTPSRKAPGPFGVRVLMGAFCGYAISGLAIAGLVAGAVGAIVGTLGGYEFRARLVKATGGKDLPIALLEDAIAVGGALWIVTGV